MHRHDTDRWELGRERDGNDSWTDGWVFLFGDVFFLGVV